MTTKLLNLSETEDHYPLRAKQDADGYVIVSHPHDRELRIYLAPCRIRALRDALTRALANLPPGSNA